MRWKGDPRNPNPAWCVHSCRKFSAVCGTTLAKSSIVSLPRGRPLTVTSIKTMGLERLNDELGLMIKLCFNLDPHHCTMSKNVVASSGVLNRTAKCSMFPEPSSLQEEKKKTDGISKILNFHLIDLKFEEKLYFRTMNSTSQLFLRPT